MINETVCFACAIVLVFIALDIISGFTFAVINRSVSSKKMREGAQHKAGIILIMVLAVVIEYAAAYVDFGIVPPLAELAAGYLSLMEVASILENIGKLNPAIKGNPLFRLLDEISHAKDN